MQQYRTHTRSAPYIFMGILIMILIFTIGIIHGRRVESKNIVNLIAYLSITPAPTTPVIPTVTRTFRRWEHPCGFSISWPTDVATESAQATCGAQLRNDK